MEAPDRMIEETEEKQQYKPAPPSSTLHPESLHRSRSEEITRTISRPRSDRPKADDPDIIIVDWDGADDPDNPFRWSLSRKLAITAVALIGTLLFQLNGTSITVAATEINEAFGISDASFPNSYWPVTSWTLGGATFILIILPLMEDFGLKNSYIVSMPNGSFISKSDQIRLRLSHSYSSSYPRRSQRTLPPKLSVVSSLAVALPRCQTASLVLSAISGKEKRVEPFPCRYGSHAIWVAPRWALCLAHRSWNSWTGDGENNEGPRRSIR